MNDLKWTDNRCFVLCKTCGKDMQGVAYFRAPMEDFWYKPEFECMRCAYKEEIEELEKK